MAISSLVLGDEDITFGARFSGKPQNLYIPIDAVLAVYAKENGQGMMFSEDDGAVSSEDDNDPDPGSGVESNESEKAEFAGC